MNVAVFGASGRSGRLIVAEALRQGHAVTAFVRDRAALEQAAHEPKLRIVEGDVLDAEAVTRAVAGQQAVVSAIGPRPKEDQMICERSIERIIAAMKSEGVARLLCITGSSDFEGFFFQKVMKPIFLREAYEDKERQEMQIYKSGLDWTIVRPGILRDGPRTGHYRLSTDTMPQAGWRVSRADLAEFVVHELKRPDYVHKTITIAY